MEIRLGAEVRLSDGTVAGRVSKVVLDPGKGVVTHLVVCGPMAGDPGRLVPVEEALTGNEREVQLRADRQALAAEPSFDPDDFITLEYGDWPGPYPVTAQPIVAWGRPYPAEGLPLRPPEPPAALPFVAVEAAGEAPAGSTVLAPDMQVRAFGGQPLGHVAEVLSDRPSGRATYLVVVDPQGEAVNHLVPVSWIRSVQGMTITLVVGPRVVERLAVYPELM